MPPHSSAFSLLSLQVRRPSQPASFPSYHVHSALAADGAFGDDFHFHVRIIFRRPSHFYPRFRDLHVLLIFETYVKFSVSLCPFISASKYAGKGGSQDSRMEFLHFSALLAETRRARAGAAARSVSTCGGGGDGGTRTAGCRGAHLVQAGMTLSPGKLKKVNQI